MPALGETARDLGNVIIGFDGPYWATRILSLKDLDGLEIPEGQTIAVLFHDDGGQSCMDGLRRFSDPIQAATFASEKMNEPGHLCGPNSVNIFLQLVSPPPPQ
jgi:hypothetical protein